MAKRGERFPWTLRFKWENGVKGTQTFNTEERAQDLADTIRRTAELREMSVEITISKREA